MYIGYADRYIYVENRKKRSWKGIVALAGAFFLGGMVVTLMAWYEDTPQKTMWMLGEQIIQKEEVISSVEVEILQTDAAPEPIIALEPDEDVIMLDPGHGGEDNGCVRDGVQEKDVNLQIALSLRNKLEAMGYKVLLTREDDETLTLDERVEIANTSDADVYISIHQNAFEQSNVSGMETWYCGTAEEIGMDRSHVLAEDCKRLAQLVHQDMVLYTKGYDRGIREEDELKVIRETKMASCLVETGFLSNMEERLQLTDVVYQSKIVEGLASGIDLYFHPKTMYLTFDDGPSAENTNTVLDILKDKNVKATFFVVGENVRKNPEVAKRIVAEGHTIGIHCNSHDYDIIYESVDSYLADFEAAYEAVYEVTGVKVELFRFPGGSINAYNKEISEDIIKAMTERGFIYFDWNGSLEDATRKNSPETILQNAKDSTLGRKKVVMLAHDIVYNTTLCLEELIEQFPEYKMEPLTADVKPIQF